MLSLELSLGVTIAWFVPRCFHFGNLFGETFCSVMNMALLLGEAFGGGLGWKHEVSDSCEIVQTRCAGAVFCVVST